MDSTPRPGLHPSPPLPWASREAENRAVDALAAELATRDHGDGFLIRLDARREAKAAIEAALVDVPEQCRREAVRDWSAAAALIVARRCRHARERPYYPYRPRRPPR